MTRFKDKTRPIRVSAVSIVRIPMMSISHSDLMPIRTERSDAELSQFETGMLQP